MSLFLHTHALCPRCGTHIKLRWDQKIIHAIRIGDRKLLRCPRCKAVSLCKGL